MSATGPPIRDISDTARWAALYRARESERPGGLFRDPLARRLAGSEGLIIYLTAEEVGALARDLAAPPRFRRWVTDLVSPGLLKLLQKKLGPQLDKASAPLKFAPEEGPEFFARHGWRPLEVRSMLHAAARLGRLPLWMRFFALFPPPKTPGSRPWSGVCQLEKKST